MKKIQITNPINKNRKNKKHCKVRSITLFLSVLLSTLSINAMADVAGDLDGFFTKLGYDGNLTPGTAYQGQAAGYYSGGSIVLRNKVKNIQLMHIDAPSLRAGCGGIDLFTGGFSFVNAPAITEFFQKIMSNAGGYMFNLALETEVPMIAHVMEQIQQMAQEINASNFNSCEMAENIIGGMMPRIEASQRHICKGIESHRNIFSDWADARQGCSDKSVNDKAMSDAATNPAYEKQVIFNKNLIWDALLKIGFLADDKSLAELFMSLSGTIIFDSEGKSKIYPPLAKDPDVIKAMLVGGKAEIYTCAEKVKCLNLSNSEINIAEKNALYTKTKLYINEIVTALIVDSSVLPPRLQGFLELTKLPILRFITAQLMSGNAAIALSITNYSESIAKTLLVQYMNEALQTVEHSLTGTDYDPDIHKQLIGQIHQALVFVENIKAQSHNDIKELMSFMNSSKEAEREAMARVIGQLKPTGGK